MEANFNIVKGTRVRVDLWRAKPLGTWSLAGAQLKTVADRTSLEGVVRHIWADDPAGTQNVRVQIELDDGALHEVPIRSIVEIVSQP
jgi:hypothetical protein